MSGSCVLLVFNERLLCTVISLFNMMSIQYLRNLIKYYGCRRKEVGGGHRVDDKREFWMLENAYPYVCSRLTMNGTAAPASHLDWPRLGICSEKRPLE